MTVVSQYKIIDQIEVYGRVTPNHSLKNKKKNRITYILFKVCFENVGDNSDTSKSEPI